MSIVTDETEVDLSIVGPFHLPCVLHEMLGEDGFMFREYSTELFALVKSVLDDFEKVGDPEFSDDLKLHVTVEAASLLLDLHKKAAKS